MQAVSGVSVRAWHRSWQHVWTAGCLLVTAPLLLEPLLLVVFGTATR